MDDAINQFRNNIQRIKNLHSIYKLFKKNTTSIIDISDILRAEIVLVVSAFDYYIHEVVKINMIEIFKGNRCMTKSYKNFLISIDSVYQALNTPSSQAWLENEISLRHSWKSFQHSDNVSDAIKLISDKNIWKEIAKKMTETPNDIKKKLNLIVDRRNKIAHEADIDPSYPGLRWPINESMVEDTIAFIENITEIIHSILK